MLELEPSLRLSAGDESPEATLFLPLISSFSSAESFCPLRLSSDLFRMFLTIGLNYTFFLLILLANALFDGSSSVSLCYLLNHVDVFSLTVIS